jgi:hypothetical protein
VRRRKRRRRRRRREGEGLKELCCCAFTCANNMHAQATMPCRDLCVRHHPVDCIFGGDYSTATSLLLELFVHELRQSARKIRWVQLCIVESMLLLGERRL